jgi:hypothetical protein
MNPIIRQVGSPFPSEPVLVPLQALRPTQAAVGMRAVAAKREKVERRAHKVRKIARFLEQRPIPAVRGPGDLLYIIDHHHLSLALWQTQVDHAYVEIVDDRSRLSREHFWARMEDEGRLHPFDETGRRIDPARLPSRLTGLRHDPYRDLAWSVRERGGFEKDEVPYSEFFWASFFRSRIALGALRSDYDWAVARAIKLAKTREAASLPGYRGK